VRLLLWRLFNQTPLGRPIGLLDVASALVSCKMSETEYLALKERYPHLWERAARNRALAEARGAFPPQPAHLRRWRKESATVRANAKVTPARKVLKLAWVTREIWQALEWRGTSGVRLESLYEQFVDLRDEFEVIMASRLGSRRSSALGTDQAGSVNGRARGRTKKTCARKPAFRSASIDAS
jgi:hypothetical protein